MGYYVIAHDGNRYGPADIATLQQWVREGRIVANTVLEDESTGTQVRASLLPELRHLFPERVGAVDNTSAPPSRAMVGGKPSSRATAALVFGIVGVICCQIFAIPALILGKQEMNAVDRGLAPVEGRGLAQAGFILGIVGIVLLILALLYFASVAQVFRVAASRARG